MLRYQDFKPQVTETSSVLGIIQKATTMDELVAEANAWIAEHKVSVFNIETLLMPWMGKNIRDLGSHFGVAEGMQVLQTVRVWYRAT
jgi:hypothetical protein